MAVLALGSIANDSPSTRDDVLNNGALLPLLSLLLNPSTAKLSMLKNATWTLLKLCRGKPPSPTLIEQIRPTLSVLRELLWMPDEEVVQNACLILSFITHEGSSETVQAVIKANICPRLVELLLQVLDRLQYPVSFFLVKLNTPVGGFINVFFFCGGLTKFPFYRFPMSKFIVPALQTLGHIASGDEAQTQILINSGALLCLKLLLTQSDKIILKIACLVISNITAGTEAQIQAVIDFDLIGRLVYLTKAEFDIRKEAAWAISNATYGTCEQIRSFASKECIKALYDLLTYPDPEIVTVCLKGLENILNAGEINKERGLHYGVNIYAKYSQNLHKESCKSLNLME
ncbi:importin subunit alpha-1b-like isoform X2 [Cicer arietinum]|uniref:importin subunit alpha-1b-like isoform X2 n=1 Tax=Cicer arietinum TaxID=3827 RepID=UPI003CC67858